MSVMRTGGLREATITPQAGLCVGYRTITLNSIMMATLRLPGCFSVCGMALDKQTQAGSYRAAVQY
jgi:hypothetical protein